MDAVTTEISLHPQPEDPADLVFTMARFSGRAWSQLHDHRLVRPIFVSKQGGVVATFWPGTYSDAAMTAERCLQGTQLRLPLANALSDMLTRYERLAGLLATTTARDGLPAEDAEAVERARKLVDQATA